MILLLGVSQAFFQWHRTRPWTGRTPSHWAPRQQTWSIQAGDAEGSQRWSPLKVSTFPGRSWGCNEPRVCSRRDRSNGNKTCPFRVHGGDGTIRDCNSRASHSVLSIQLDRERHATAFLAGTLRATHPGHRHVRCLPAQAQRSRASSGKGSPVVLPETQQWPFSAIPGTSVVLCLLGTNWNQ